MIVSTKSRMARASVKVDLNGGLGVGSTVGLSVPWAMGCAAHSFKFLCSFCYPSGASPEHNVLECIWCGVVLRYMGGYYRVVRPPQVLASG